MQTKLKLGSQHDPSLGPERSNRNAHCRLWNCAASLSPALLAPSHLPQLGKAEKCGWSRPRPPQGQPNGDGPSASPPPRSVTAGGSRSLATPRPRLRRRPRADARQPQNGGGGASRGESRACQTPFSLPLPRLHRSGVTVPARRKPEPHPEQISPPTTQGVRPENGKGGAHNPCIKATITTTALPPSQHPKGDVPQRPPRVNCAHWTPSSAKRAALATRDLSDHEEASIREAIPSK